MINLIFATTFLNLDAGSKSKENPKDRKSDSAEVKKIPGKEEKREHKVSLLFHHELIQLDYNLKVSILISMSNSRLKNSALYM